MFFSILALTVLSISQQASHALAAAAGHHKSGQVAAAWYTGWHASEGFPLSAIHWNKYNTLIYSFAVTTPSVHHLSLNGSAPSLLPEFVKEAHANHVAAHIAIGGWSGGVYFSSNLATPENRTAFVNTVAHFAEKHDLDGINFDWEYPNLQGIGCNTINAKDTENFLSFLQELRANPVGAKLTLSAATSIVPFSDASGHPSANVSGFAEVFDYIAIMNYDVWGSWSTGVGPNAPLKDACAASANRQGSAVSAVKAWTTAGMPVDKIVLGVASYGHSFSVAPSDAFVKGSQTKLAPYPKFNASRQPPGDAWGSVRDADPCGGNDAPSGIYNFWGLVVGGFLDKEGKVAPGIYHRYGSCSETPYVYNQTSEIMVSFDDARSFSAKGSFIKETGLKGFAMWEAGGDYGDILLDSIRHAAGFD